MATCKRFQDGHDNQKWEAVFGGANIVGYGIPNKRPNIFATRILRILAFQWLDDLEDEPNSLHIIPHLVAKSGTMKL